MDELSIMDEFQTIQSLILMRGSISRYGDGELKLCTGRRAKSQPGGTEIRKRLCEILRKPVRGHLVGIPRIAGRHDWPTKEKGIFWNKYVGSPYKELYDPRIMYASAFITRPDTNIALDTPEYFDLVKQLWRDRPVLLCQGVGMGFLKAKPCLFDTAQNYTIYYGPPYDAYASYQTILNDLLEKSTEPDIVVVLSLGPTATVLAYDLCRHGRQALDLGHLGMFYAHVHPKSRIQYG